MESPEPAIVIELTSAIDPITALRRTTHLPGCLLLHSALSHPYLGRYTFLCLDPVELFEMPNYFVQLSRTIPPRTSRQQRGLPSSDWTTASSKADELLLAMAMRLAQFSRPPLPGLPPFQGGVAGFVGYEFGSIHPVVAMPRWDEFRLPWLSLGLYDLVIAWDHLSGQCWIISQGFPETTQERRTDRARQRAEWIQHMLEGDCPSGDASPARPIAQLSADRLAPMFSVDPRINSRLDDLRSNLDQPEYLRMVERAIEYILDGDIYQVNLSQRLIHPARMPPVELFTRLTEVNPAPFAGYYDFGRGRLISASPERFFSQRYGLVETRPIKGTRRRSGQSELKQIQHQLSTSEKDRAENIMIVDLMRNDLSKVCRDDSIEVTQLCEVEVYPTVLHLVSAIIGAVRDGCDVGQILKALFPGGSITGAPKIRAQEIIAELEPTARGPYCGSLGYISVAGEADWNILIRTITESQGWWQVPVGGGIVTDSDPESEYDESWAKAEGLLSAISSAPH